MSEKTNIEWATVAASNGYILRRVGKAHHLADCRGYAYEHRLVAEQKIGRRLKPGELVHHLNGNRQDNSVGNLEVVESIAKHLLKHRKPESTLRLPGEDNPTIACACGCGVSFIKYDKCGRPRKFISGHNPQKTNQKGQYVGKD